MRVLFVQGSNPAVTAPPSGWCSKAWPATTCSPWCTTRCSPTPRSTPTSCCPPRRTSRPTTSPALRLVHSPARRRRSSTGSARAARTTRSMPGSRLGSGSTLARYALDPDALMVEGLGGGVAAAAGGVEVLHAPGHAPCSSATRSPTSTTARRGSRRRSCGIAPVPALPRARVRLPALAHHPGDASHDQLDVRRVQRGRSCVRIHPDDADARGSPTATLVRMWNDLGAIEVVARLDADLRPGVVSMPKGLWRRDRARRTHRQRARARHPERPCGRRVLQRRPRRDRARQPRLDELDPVAVRVLDDRDRHAGTELVHRHRDLVPGSGARVDDLVDVVDADRPVAVAQRLVDPARRAAPAAPSDGARA